MSPQVYIVAMREGGGSDPLSPGGGGGGDLSDLADPSDPAAVGCSEDLLSLVRPELANLAKHWLAALKDQALLSLPPGECRGGGGRGVGLDAGGSLSNRGGGGIKRGTGS